MKKISEMSLEEKKALLQNTPLKPLAQMSREEKMALLSKNQGRSPSVETIAPKIIQEELPEVGVLERAKLKTFGNSPESMAQALMQNPNLESEVSKDGQVLVRAKGSRDWNVLDPDTGIDPLSFGGIKELGKDMLEGAYDVGTGLVEGAASLGAGVAAGAATGGAAAIPAAMGTGAALSAGNEALRQKIGAALGIPQEVNMDDVKMSGAFGAASPLLLGTGGALKNTAKGALKNELFQSGLIGTGGKKALTGSAELFTGIKGDLFKRATKDPALMKQISETGEDVVANDAIANVFTKVEDRYKDLGSRINEKLRGSNEMVDVSKAKDAIKSLAERIQSEAKGGFSSEDRAKLEGLTGLYKKTFNRTQDVAEESVENILGKNGEVMINPITEAPLTRLVQKTNTVESEIPDMVPASEAFKIKEELTNAADFMSDKFRGNKSQSDKTLSTIAKKAYGETSEAISSSLKEAPALNKEYQDTLKDIEFIKTKFKNPKALMGDDLAFDEKGAKQLYKIGGGGDRALERKAAALDKQYGTNLVDESKNIAAANLNEDAGWFNRSVRGVTSTSRTNTGQLLGGAAGALAGQQLGDGGSNPLANPLTYVGGALGTFATSPRAFLNYIKTAEKASKIPMGARESAWNLMQNKGQ
jgi:hypothetical protein